MYQRLSRGISLLIFDKCRDFKRLSFSLPFEVMEDGGLKLKTYGTQQPQIDLAKIEGAYCNHSHLILQVFVCFANKYNFSAHTNFLPLTFT